MNEAVLTMDEQQKYEIIKNLADHPDANKQRAALTLGCSLRHINRMLAGYKQCGRDFFIHGNKGRKPATTIPAETKTKIVQLYQTKYFNANFQHFTELLNTVELIKISASTVSSILEENAILSPRVTKAKKKRIKKQLDEKMNAAKTKKEENEILANLIALEDAHPRRSRSAYAGELQQMDASSLVWFGKEKTTLHVAVDDATGAITGAWFDKEETLNAYYHVLEQILKNHGIPYMFLTDRRTVFDYTRKKSPSMDEDTHTQFAYACQQLGILLETTSIPQAKGRVERLNQTLQSRLPIELRLKGITTMDEANEFLNSYIKEFNAKFALPIHDTKSVFEKQPSDEKLNLILAVLTERTVDSGHSIQFHKSYYRMLDKNGKQVCFRSGTKVMVIKAFDGQLYCCVNDKDIYVLELIAQAAEKSKNIDHDYAAPKEKKQTIPDMNHPWRRSNFRKFVREQPHHSADKEETVTT